MILETKFIHHIAREDIAFYKSLCPKNSYYFSNSEAYLNSYFNTKNALCYNDNKTIFFFGRFSRDTLFFCCPKGKNIKSKIKQFMFFAKDNYKSKKIWLFEISGFFSQTDFYQLNFKSWQTIKMERSILSLKKFKKLSLFLKENQKLRGKWNQFFNFLKRTEKVKKIELKPISKKNLKDVKRIIAIWQKKTKEKNSFISSDIITKKNLNIIDDVFSRPELYEIIVFYCNNIPRGIRAAFKIEDSSNLGASMLCTDRIIPQSATIFNLLFFQLMAKKNYKLINLGNSYTQSINSFKKQFKPDKYDITYEYHLSF